MTPSLARSYRYCEALSRQAAGSFYPAFHVLPRPQRWAMCALYAFLRIADDLCDEPGAVPDKRRRLSEWRSGLEQALAGAFSHPGHEALCHAVRTFAIPPVYLQAVLDGVEMDLEPIGFPAFADLRVYCYRVASAVGLACIHIWGFTDERAKEFAENAGLAFQLTNILRDLGEDAARGRVYLPREDLDRFGYSADALRRRERSEAFRKLMRFEVERARGYYDAAWPLVPLLSREGRAIFLLMAKSYRGLLEEIEKRDYDVFSARITLGRWKKWRFALEALPARLGWL
ncbi:MAG: squalene/phytoene synthase family protein [Gemmataceae bacterium]|nr:squalene/phytoene synthase family protein [Gemmataceae bacterium]